MEKHRIIAIAQIYNELERGNLIRFVQHLRPIVDAIVVYDDGSTDGSARYLTGQGIHVIPGKKNDFRNEKQHRIQLLEAAKKLGADFILWLDADEVLTAGAAKRLQELASECERRTLDAMSFHEINLWRSHSWRRTDNAYDDGWYVRLWRVTPSLRFWSDEQGLHGRLYPESIQRIEKVKDLEVLHFGFASDESILFKYLTYRRHGQAGEQLRRLVDERTLTLERVHPARIPPELVRDDPKPTPRPLSIWYDLIEQRRGELLRPRVSIACLIYKSTAWLDFVYRQVIRYTDLSDKEFFFLANDASPTVVQHLRERYIPHHVFESTPTQRQEWYINNVYRGYNYAAEVARGDLLLFVNSDMAFSPGWVERLLERLDGANCVASRLVESGKMLSGTYGISRNFGRSVKEYDERGFLRYARRVAEPRSVDGGLFMPLLIERKHFSAVGGYPEGNAVPGSDPFKPTIAKHGEPVVSGDVILMEKLRQRGIRHETALDSIVYHFQQGETDDSATPAGPATASIAIVNDHLTGVMGEKTMWNFLLERLPSTVGVDVTVIGNGAGFERRAKRHLVQSVPKRQVVIQNATFLGFVDPSTFTVAYLQDDLRRMNRRSEQQETNLRRANLRVSNSRHTADSYSEYNFEIIPIGVDTDIFKLRDRVAIRKEFGYTGKKVGIFVGDLTAVKGWPEVKAIIEHRRDIFWIVVSKGTERYEGRNVAMFNRIEQEQVAKLHAAADFFLLGSPVETQCLAAIEAGLSGLPIIMHDTGIFADFSPAERDAVGFFSPTLEDKIDLVFQRSFHPRDVLLKRKLSVDGMIERWQTLLTEALQTVAATKYAASFVRPSLPVVIRRRTSAVGRHLLQFLRSITRVLLPRRVADRLYTTFINRQSLNTERGPIGRVIDRLFFHLLR